MTDEMAFGPDRGRVNDYGDESVGTRRQAAPEVFAALDAVFDLHRETEQEDAARGHWEGEGSSGRRWVRDRPAWCPVCKQEQPCETRRVIAENLR